MPTPKNALAVATAVEKMADTVWGCSGKRKTSGRNEKRRRGGFPALEDEAIRLIRSLTGWVIDYTGLS